VVDFNPLAEWQEYAELQRDYADDVNVKPYNVEMLELDPNQCMLGLYWDEQLTEKGVIFTVIVPADTNTKDTKELAKRLNANRDVLAINFKYYTPYEG